MPQISICGSPETEPPEPVETRTLVVRRIFDEGQGLLHSLHHQARNAAGNSLTAIYSAETSCSTWQGVASPTRERLPDHARLCPWQEALFHTASCLRRCPGATWSLRGRLRQTNRETASTSGSPLSS